MYASLTSTWISSESMSTMVPMPVRIDPPPAEIGEIISPGCAAFTVTTPANGARTMVLSSWTWAALKDSWATRTALAWLEVRAREASDCVRAASSAEALVSFSSSISCWRLYSRVGIGARCLRLDRCARAGSDLRAPKLDLHARFRIVERSEDFASLNALAFLDAHFTDLAGDLGGHGGLAAGRDVTGCVEYGGARARRRHGTSGCDRHFDRFVTIEVPKGRRDRQEHYPAKRNPQAQPERRPVLRRIAIDAQFLEQFGFVQVFCSVGGPGVAESATDPGRAAA